MKRFMEHHLNRILLAGVLSLTLVAAGTALAQGPAQGPGKCGGPGSQLCVPGEAGSRGEMQLERMAARLGLTDEQTKAIGKIHEEGRRKNLEIRKEMMRLRNELQGELLKDSPAQKKVLELNEKLGGLRTRKQAVGLQNRLAVRELLTPQQRDQMLLMGDFGKGQRGGSHHGQRGPRAGNCGDSGRCGPGGGGQACPKTNR